MCGPCERVAARCMRRPAAFSGAGAGETGGWRGNRGRHRAGPSGVSSEPMHYLYALTRICVMEYTGGVESVFEIIAEPNRRAILSLLASSQQSVGEIERQLRMPQPTV